MVYQEPNEFLVLVLDKDLKSVLQRIDSSCLDADTVGLLWAGWRFLSEFPVSGGLEF